MSGNNYRLTLDLYLDCAGANITPQTIRVFPEGCYVNFTYSNLLPISSTEVSPLCPQQVQNSTCNGGTLPSYKLHRIQGVVPLSPCPNYRMSWGVCCRNTTVNLSTTWGMYAEILFNNFHFPNDACPEFIDSGIPYVCVGEPIQYNPGVTDVNGDWLEFSLISARYYPFPSPAAPVTYAPGYSGTAPIPGITINPLTGQLSFTANIIGNYVVVIEVKSYTGPGGTFKCSTMRDLMFVVIPCDGSPPLSPGVSNVTPGIVYGPNSIGVCQGTSFCMSMVFTDVNPSSFITLSSNASTELPGSAVTIVNGNPATFTVCWTANLALLPANVFVSANDGACPIANVASRSILIGDCMVLPSELIAFRAEAGRSSVELSWSTASERNTDFYSVERSRDGMVFDRVGVVEAVGHSVVEVHYSMVDPAPLPGISYYRLVQHDLDGATTVSHMVPVTFGEGAGVSAASDPTGAWLVSGAARGAEWYLLDMTGRQVDAGTVQDEPFRVEGGGASARLLRVIDGQRQHVLKLPPVEPGSAPILVQGTGH